MSSSLQPWEMLCKWMDPLQETASDAQAGTPFLSRSCAGFHVQGPYQEAFSAVPAQHTSTTRVRELKSPAREMLSQGDPPTEVTCPTPQEGRLHREVFLGVRAGGRNKVDSK